VYPLPKETNIPFNLVLRCAHLLKIAFAEGGRVYIFPKNAKKKI